MTSATATPPVPTTEVEATVVKKKIITVARYCLGCASDCKRRIQRTEDGPWEVCRKDISFPPKGAIMAPWCPECKRTLAKKMPDVVRVANKGWEF